MANKLPEVGGRYRTKTDKPKPKVIMKTIEERIAEIENFVYDNNINRPFGTINTTPEQVVRYTMAKAQGQAECLGIIKQLQQEIEELKKDKWQPIETAPKNGTWIILTGGDAEFDDYKREVQNTVGFPPASVAFWHEDYWTLCYWDGEWRTEYGSPTHWKPLPPHQNKRSTTK
jgi:hypothetical protein